MKTFSQRFLKGALAILLVVVMLFGSTISGFAAVVDNADTKANVDAAQTGATLSSDGTAILFMDLSSPNWWLSNSGKNNFCYFFNSSSNQWSAHAVHYSGNDYYVVVPKGDWTTVILTRNNTTTAPSWNNKWNQTGNISLSNTKNCLYGFSENNTSASWSSIQADSDVSLSASSTSVDVNTNVTLTPSLTSNTTFNTIKSTSYSISPTTGAEISGNTFKATKAGTYTVTASITYNARGFADITKTQTATTEITVKEAGYSYTVTAGEGGTVSPTSGTATSATITATPDTGYEFAGWEVTGNGSVANASNASTTLTINANGVVANATFAKKTYTVKFFDGETQIGQTQTVEHGGNAVDPGLPKKDGYTSKWDKEFTNITADTEVNVVYTANDHTVKVSAEPTAGGSVKINNADVESSTVKYNDDVTVLATAKTGYEFAGWYNGTENVSSDASYTFKCSGDVTLVAKFKKVQLIIEAVASPEGAGEVTVNDGASATIEYGEEVTLKAVAKDGYRFQCWMRNNTEVSVEPTFVDTPQGNATYTATFVKIWDVTVEVPTGVNVVSFSSTGTSSTHTYTGIKDGLVTTYHAEPDTGYEIVGWKVTKNGEVEEFDTETVTVTIDADTTITPVVGKLYYAIVDGDTDTSDNYHPAGETVTLTFTVPSGQYLQSVTSSPAMSLNVDNIAGTVTFTMPENNVIFTPNFADCSKITVENSSSINVTGLNSNGYKPGETATITLTPKSEGVSITSVVADYDGAVIKKNSNGSWTVTIASMPADTTITITPEVDAKFVMNYGMVAIGNYGSGYTSTSHYGTVSMKIGNTALAQGGFAAPTDTVTYTAAPSNNFVFDGWYSDAACTPAKLLSREKTYDVKPKSDTTIYALFVPKHRLYHDYNKLDDGHEMTYVPEDRMFVYTSNDIAGDAWFAVTNDGKNTANPSYHHFNSPFTVTMNGQGGDMSVSWGNGGAWVLNSNSHSHPYTFALTINGNESVDISATSGAFGDMIYLSAGHLDLETGTHNSAVFDADTTLIESTITLSDKQYVKDEGNTREVYRTGIVTEPQNITFQTVISGSCTEGDIPKYTVANYVVYYIDTGKYDIITPNVVNSTTFQGTAYVDGPCYITPIYFVPDEYADANGLANIDIYFDVAGIQNLKWGPFVACYAWGNNGDYDYLGSWSGQLMIPTKDRKSFYTQLTVPAADAENPASVPNGVTFNNYLQATVPGNHAAAFGISSTQYQCYDYREPLTLYEQGYEVITFVVKESKDGYHGDHPNGVTQNKVLKQNYSDLTTRFKFDYLYSRDGETPMDLNGDEIVDYKNINAGEKADYYIVAKGDNQYYKDQHGYAGDESYEGKWTVEWFVFDSTGKYLTNIISDAFYNEKPEGVTYLLDALGLTAEQVSGKTVAISYELLNQYSFPGSDHQLAYDGQWYGNMLDHTVTGNVVVGLRDGDNFEVNVNDPLNEAAYGDAYITDENGDKHQSLLISLDSGEINLTASAKTDSSDPNDVKKYTFDGWYTVDANGDFTKIGDALSITEYINNNETYYAFFRELGEHAVTITHTAYNNPNDPDIESHGGVGEMYVEVKDKNKNIVAKGLYSTSSSMAEFTADEGETYTITISTTPLMNGQFYAWYTDSFKADDTKTYEEILTEEGHKYCKTKVEATFEYKYDPTDPLLQTNINIYSDIVRVSNKATIKFKYLNRYNNPCTYTIKDIPLTDAECMGYEGNGGNAYVPTYYYYLTLDNDKKIYVEPGTEGNYTYIESENNIQKYVPDENVTEAFNSTIKWVLDKKFITISPSLIEISADQDLPEYTINYSMPGESGSQRGVFNTLMKVSAPSKDNNGKPFSYWYEPATGEILSYSQHYNYKIVENKTIEAVYGEEITQEWTPSINSVTLTREFKDDGDFVYTDYLLAFNNKDGKILTDIYKDENIKYGLLVLRDANYYIDEKNKNNIEYPDVTNPDIANYLKRTAKEKEINMAFTVDGTKYNCYFYGLTGNKTTVFNRCDYYVRYHNNYEVAPGKYYRDYALTAVAYIIVDGQVYLSQPKNVNFYELGNMQVRSVN